MHWFKKNFLKEELLRMQQELRDRLEIEKQKVETLRLKLPKSELKKETENEDNEETLNTILDELLKENARLEVCLSHKILVI